MCAETPKQPKKGERESGRRTDSFKRVRGGREREEEEGRGGRRSEVEVRCGGGWSFHSIVQLPDRPDGGGFHQRSQANRSLLREREPRVCVIEAAAGDGGRKAVPLCVPQCWVLTPLTAVQAAAKGRAARGGP